MIVLMTVMGIKVSHSKKSRFLYLLFLFLISSCNNKAESQIIDNSSIFTNSMDKSTSNDSLEIVVKNIPANKSVSLLYNDSNLKSKNIDFENNTNTTRAITQKILKTTKFDYTILYRTFTMVDNKLQNYYYDYLIKRPAKKIEFEFDKNTGNLKLVGNNENITQYDFLVKGYEKIARRANKIPVQKKLQEISDLHESLKIKYKNSELSAVNDLVFYKQMSLLSQDDRKIEEYLISLKNPIWSTDLLVIVYQYLESKKNNITTLNIEDKKNSIYNNLIALGISNHLIEYKEKQYSTYIKNLAWFKSTKYYEENKNTLETLFKTDKVTDIVKSNLLSFDLQNDGKLIKLQNLLNTHNSKYYLLDFWATWCIPCLQNIEAIHGMDLPKEIKVIYISMDRTKDKEKWIKKANNLHLGDSSYLFAETKNNKNVIDKINLNQLPRYILIDSKFNIINPNLATPQETDFLKELNLYLKK